MANGDIYAQSSNDQFDLSWKTDISTQLIKTLKVDAVKHKELQKFAQKLFDLLDANNLVEKDGSFGGYKCGDIYLTYIEMDLIYEN